MQMTATLRARQGTLEGRAHHNTKVVYPQVHSRACKVPSPLHPSACQSVQQTAWQRQVRTMSWL